MHQELITQVSLVASVCNWDQNRTNWNCRGLAVPCEILLDDDFAAHSAAADFSKVHTFCLAFFQWCITF